MRRMRMMLLLLTMVSLAACGAAPQAAAPTENPTAIDGALATAVPAATAAQAATPAETQAVAVPTTTSTTNTHPTDVLPTTQLPTRPVRLTPVIDSVPTAQATPAIVGEVPTDLMDKILADAAQLSGVAASSIIVQMSQAVEWPDGSLGCPKPGVAYLQVITSGYHVVLLAGTVGYDYRADERGRFFVCKG